MPSAADFRRAFELGEGQKLGGFTTEGSTVGHDVVEENERYEFPTTLTLSGGKGRRSEQRLQAQLQQAWKQHMHPASRIVYSAYGSPYECSYGAAKVSVLDADSSTFQLTALGKAVRRRDIPTKAQEKAQERQERGVPDDVSREDKARYLQNYRVIKSRFGSSKCSICGVTIEPGIKIAKNKSQETPGGWAHATCLVHQLKQQEDEAAEVPAQKSRKRAAASAGSTGKRSRAASKARKGGQGAGSPASEPAAAGGGQQGVSRKQKQGAKQGVAGGKQGAAKRRRAASEE